MNLIADVPLIGLVPLVFCLRIADVSLGTMRTITVVNGRIKLSVLLGFLEVLIWITAISSVILRISEHPILLAAYAGGFAAGNAVGILLERQLAMGDSAVRIVTREGTAVAEAAGRWGRVIASFGAEPPDADKKLVFAVLSRRNVSGLRTDVRSIDENAFWIVERFAETSPLIPLPRATGWRAMAKMK